MKSTEDLLAQYCKDLLNIKSHIDMSQKYINFFRNIIISSEYQRHLILIAKIENKYNDENERLGKQIWGKERRRNLWLNLVDYRIKTYEEKFGKIDNKIFNLILEVLSHDLVDYLANAPLCFSYRCNKLLDKIGIDHANIPKDLIDPLTDTVYDSPVILPSGETISFLPLFYKYCHTNELINPYTNKEFKLNDLKLDEECQEKIQNELRNKVNV